MTNTKTILGVIGAVLILIGLVTFTGTKSDVATPATVGADAVTNPQWFVNGASFGKNNWFLGGNAGDSTLGVSTSSRGTNPVLSFSTTGGLTLTGILTSGGGVTATTTDTTASTLAVTDFDNENVIDVTPGAASVTLSFPATSSLTSFIPATGQTRTIFIRNATTTAGVNILVASSTGVIVNSASTSALIMSTTGAKNYGKLDFVRKANTDISVLLTLFNN